MIVAHIICSWKNIMRNVWGCHCWSLLSGPFHASILVSILQVFQKKTKAFISSGKSSCFDFSCERKLCPLCLTELIASLAFHSIINCLNDCFSLEQHWSCWCIRVAQVSLCFNHSPVSQSRLHLMAHWGPGMPLTRRGHNCSLCIVITI